jgi:hypothetical protein
MAGGVAQGVGLEFKSQFCQKKKKAKFYSILKLFILSPLLS